MVEVATYHGSTIKMALTMVFGGPLTTYFLKKKNALCRSLPQAYRTHILGIFTYIWLTVNSWYMFLGKYASPMGSYEAMHLMRPKICPRLVHVSTQKIVLKLQAKCNKSMGILVYTVAMNLHVISAKQRPKFTFSNNQMIQFVTF